MKLQVPPTSSLTHMVSHEFLSTVIRWLVRIKTKISCATFSQKKGGVLSGCFSGGGGGVFSGFYKSSSHVDRFPKKIRSWVLVGRAYGSYLYDFWNAKLLV